MKSSFTKRCSLVAAAATLLASADLVWGGVIVDRIVAVVNREVITQSELDEAAQAFKRAGMADPAAALDSPGGPHPPDPNLQRDLLNQMIEQKLFQQEAKKSGIRVSDAELDLALRDIEERNRFPNREALRQAVTRENVSWEKYVEDLRNQLAVLKMMNREIDANLLITDAEVRAYYEAHPEAFRLPEQIRLKQILIRIPEGASTEVIETKRQKAEAVLAEFREGENFVRLVERYSEGTERRAGGDLGAFKKGELTPEIDRVVFGLGDGEVSPIIQTGLGFHLFKAEVPSEVRTQPFEKVKKEIEEKLLNEKRAALRKKWMDEIWSRSFVEVK